MQKHADMLQAQHIQTKEEWMRTSVILALALVMGVALAAAPATSDTQTEQVKLYYGLPGSNDFVWGTVGVNEPSDAWALHSNLPAALMDNAATADANCVW